MVGCSGVTGHRDRSALMQVFDPSWINIVDLDKQAEVDDVDPQLRVEDLHERTPDALARSRRSHPTLRSTLRLLVVRCLRCLRSYPGPGHSFGHTLAGNQPTGTRAIGDVQVSIRALIVDDHPSCAKGVPQTLQSDDAIVVVGDAATGEAIAQARALRPDVVLMDISMPNLDGIEATRRIKDAAPDTKVILITVDESRGAVSEAIQAGVSGYLLKDATPDALVDAARNAVEGNAVIHPQLTKTFIEEARTAGDEQKTTPLSKREREILQKVADGATTRQVASDLGISPHTVKTHLERIFEKLDANDRAQAVAIAIRTGIVH